MEWFNFYIFQLSEMYKNQQQMINQNQNDKAKEDDEDDY